MGFNMLLPGTLRAYLCSNAHRKKKTKRATIPINSLFVSLFFLTLNSGCITNPEIKHASDKKSEKKKKEANRSQTWWSC